MRICYFGSYDREYARNRIIIKGLNIREVEVIECQDKSKFIVTRYLKLITKALSLNFDAIIVGYPGHLSVFPAKLVSILKRKPLIFDAFISIYNTNVEVRNSVDTPTNIEGHYIERMKIKEDSLISRFYFWLDKYSCKLADVVLLDTLEHVKYFHETFGIRKSKLKPIPIGADEGVFHPEKGTKDESVFLVLFYGRSSIIHGIDHILKAAKLLEHHKDIKFLILRDFIDVFKDIERKNIIFKNAVPYHEIPTYIASADVCLGIFENVNKTMMVVPNKAYESIAMGKPLITGDTPAAREIFTDRKNAILCRIADGQAIADSILLLKVDEKLRTEIGKNGYELFKKNFTSDVIGQRILDLLNVINSKVRSYGPKEDLKWKEL